MANGTYASWNETWSLNRAGYFVWLGVSLVALLCLLVFRARPSNGVNRTLAQLFAAEIVSSTLWLISEGLHLPQEEPLLAGAMEWWRSLMFVFTVGVAIRIAAIIGFKRSSTTCGFISASWAFTFAIPGAMTTQLLLKQPIIAFYIGTAYYGLGILFLTFMVMREWIRAVCDDPKDAKPKAAVVKVKSIFSGLSNKVFTTFGLFGMLATISAGTVFVLGTFGFQIWRFDFLTNLIVSGLYAPFFVAFAIWADCPANIKMRGVGDDLMENEEDREKGIPLSGIVVEEVKEIEGETGMAESGAEPMVSFKGNNKHQLVPAKEGPEEQTGVDNVAMEMTYDNADIKFAA